jgi:hypothetical protein
MAVECNPDRMPVNKVINLLVKREIMRHEQGMNDVRIRDMPGTVYFPAIDRPDLDNAIRITQGKRQWRTVEVDNHT